MTETSTAESLLLDRFCAGWQTVTRRSEREFDLSVEGVRVTDEPDNFQTVTVIENGVAQEPYTYNAGGHRETRFGAWLPLAVIREHPLGWSDAVFAMSDYPSMAGDWSAIRDSEPETIWSIFDYLMERGERKASRTPKRAVRVSIA